MYKKIKRWFYQNKDELIFKVIEVTIGLIVNCLIGK